MERGVANEEVFTSAFFDTFFVVAGFTSVRCHRRRSCIRWGIAEAEDKVIITAGGERYQLLVDLKKCEAYGVDQKKYALRHEDSILYLPVHFYADIMNCAVVWNKEKGILTLCDERKKKEVAGAYSR